MSWAAPLVLSTVAGLATGIGGAVVAYAAKRPGKRVMAFSLACKSAVARFYSGALQTAVAATCRGPDQRVRILTRALSLLRQLRPA